MSKLCEKITKETSFMFGKMMVLARRVNEVKSQRHFSYSASTNSRAVFD